MKEHQVFYVGQKAFIEKDGQVLILNDPTEGLDFPGGRIQIDEIDWAESLKREVREETSLEIDVGAPFATWSHIFPAHHRHVGKKIFLVGYRCTYLSGNITLSDEHDSFQWVTRKNYQEVAFDRSNYFDALATYFKT